MKLTADTITDDMIRELRKADRDVDNCEPGDDPTLVSEFSIMIGRSKTVSIMRSLPPLEWLTGAARDVVRIAVGIAGFDAKELITALALQKSRGERLNSATVYRVLGEIADKQERTRCAEILNARNEVKP